MSKVLNFNQYNKISFHDLSLNGDASFNNDVFVSNNLVTNNDIQCNNNLLILGDVSWNPNNLANDCIPSSAVIGGAGGSSAFSANGDDIYFNNGNVGIGITSPGSKLDVDGSIRAGYDTNTTSYFGRAAIGHATNTSDFASFSHIDHNNTTSFCIAQYSAGGTIINSKSSAQGTRFKIDGNEKMRLTDSGRLGIGTTSPRGLFEVANTHGTGHNGSDAIYFRTSGDYFGWRYYSRWNRSWDFMFQRQNDVFYVYFQNSTSRGGYFDPNQNVGQFTFTGQHRNFVENIPSTEAEDYNGLIVSANKNTYYDIDYLIKTGSDAIKINDALPFVSLCKKEKDKSCYGVISNGEDGEVREYSTGTFVSVNEKQYGDNRMFINSVGEGAIWVSNKNGNLESGDYITTSSIPGYGEKQDSEFLANYSVAKITMDCDFQPDYIYKKKVTTRNVDITGPDASGNYYDVLNNERLYTVDLSNEIVDNNNKKYILTFDSANNLIGATQNMLDEKGQIQWEDTTEQEYTYKIRHVDPSGNIITKENHDSTISNGGSAYIAAFVGCTYHCG